MSFEGFCLIVLTLFSHTKIISNRYLISIVSIYLVSRHLCQTYAVIQPLLQNESLGWLMKMSIVNFIIVLYFCSMWLQQKNQFTFKTGKFPTTRHEAPVCLYMSGNPCVYLLRKCVSCVSHKISWIVKQKISKHA